MVPICIMYISQKGTDRVTVESRKKIKLASENQILLRASKTAPPEKSLTCSGPNSLAVGGALPFISVGYNKGNGMQHSRDNKKEKVEAQVSSCKSNIRDLESPAKESTI